jgi:hypothetical protein
MSDQRELELREEIMQMDYIGITKRIAELEAENARLRDEIQSAIYAMSCPVSASGSGALAILRKALLGVGDE